jgi:5-methyltetrahydropteroyltriglutamate--homocysteine methyltransferase
MTTQLDFTSVYRHRMQCAEAFVPAIRRDIRRLVAAGCDYIQIEEALTPGVVADNRTAGDMARLVNACIEDISGCTFLLHVCFGSFTRLPYAKRSYRGIFPTLLEAKVHGFSIEFGSREMAEIELVGEWDRDRILSAGLIDIKTHYTETPEDLIERLRICLKYRAPEKIEISSDCGFTRVPRSLAKKKLQAAAAAARRLRQELTGVSEP